MDYSPALESIFANAEQQCAGLVETITTAINSKINTIEDGEKLVLDLSAEAAKFNQSLLTLDNIKSQIEAGEMSKEDGVAQATPIVKDLKANCCALKMSGAELSDSEDITTEEIAILREIISSAKSAAEARVVDLRTAGDPTTNTEVDDMPTNGVLESLLNVEPAEESTNSKLFYAMRNSTEAKTAATLKKNAKKLYSMGSKEKAVTYMTKAKSIYDKLAEKCKKNANFYDVDRTVSHGGVKDTFKSKATADVNSFVLMEYFQDLADGCKAYLLQWQNKSGNSTLAETKAQLKAERKEERKRIREERKAAKANAKSATESYELDPSIQNLVDALESHMDRLEADELAMALEATSEDSEPSGLGAKIRALLHRAKKSKAEGNDADANKALSEAKSAVDELDAEAKKANTPEKKKHTARNIAIATAAIAAVGLAVTGAKVGSDLNKGFKASGEGKFNMSDAKFYLDAAKKVKAAEKEDSAVDPSTMKKGIGQLITNVKNWTQNKVKGAKALPASGESSASEAPSEESFTMPDNDLSEGNESASLTGIFDSLGINTDPDVVTESFDDESEFDDAAMESMLAVWAVEDGVED